MLQLDFAIASTPYDLQVTMMRSAFPCSAASHLDVAREERTDEEKSAGEAHHNDIPKGGIDHEWQTGRWEGGRER